MEEKAEKKKRIRYSQNFKRMALLKMIRGDSPKDIFTNCGYDTKELFAADKKYASKLLYKWKKELYKNKDMLSLLNIPFTKEDIVFELELTTYEDDFIKDEAKRLIRDKQKSILKRKQEALKTKLNI